FVPRRPRRPGSTRFPYTTLFRSARLVRPAALGQDAGGVVQQPRRRGAVAQGVLGVAGGLAGPAPGRQDEAAAVVGVAVLRVQLEDRKSTRLNSSHRQISYAVFCL